jgi:hypothetical protein
VLAGKDVCGKRREVFVGRLHAERSERTVADGTEKGKCLNSGRLDRSLFTRWRHKSQDDLNFRPESENNGAEVSNEEN